METQSLDYVKNPAFDDIKLLGSESLGVYLKIFITWSFHKATIIMKFIYRWTLLLAAQGIIEFIKLFIPFCQLFRRELLALLQFCVAAVCIGGIALLLLFGIFYC